MPFSCLDTGRDRFDRFDRFTTSTSSPTPSNGHRAAVVNRVYAMEGAGDEADAVGEGFCRDSPTRLARLMPPSASTTSRTRLCRRGEEPMTRHRKETADDRTT